jgi:hypothetical protein
MMRINWFEIYADPYLGFDQSQILAFDNEFEDIMTQIQLVKMLQSKILETLVNSELLRTDLKTITNLNTYYIQFLLSKR